MVHQVEKLGSKEQGDFDQIQSGQYCTFNNYAGSWGLTLCSLYHVEERLDHFLVLLAMFLVVAVELAWNFSGKWFCGLKCQLHSGLESETPVTAIRKV